MHAAAYERQVICSQFMRKPLLAKLLEMCLLVPRVPLQIPIDIGPMSLTLHAVNRRFVFWP